MTFDLDKSFEDALARLGKWDFSLRINGVVYPTIKPTIRLMRDMALMADDPTYEKACKSLAIFPDPKPDVADWHYESMTGAAMAYICYFREWIKQNSRKATRMIGEDARAQARRS